MCLQEKWVLKRKAQRAGYLLANESSLSFDIGEPLKDGIDFLLWNTENRESKTFGIFNVNLASVTYILKRVTLPLQNLKL